MVDKKMITFYKRLLGKTYTLYLILTGNTHQYFAELELRALMHPIPPHFQTVHHLRFIG